MTNPAPRTGHRRRNRATYEACAAALGTTPEAVATQVDLEIAAGYQDGDDAVGAAYLHLADLGCGRCGLRGPRPADPYVAAAYRKSPSSSRNADGRLDSALRALGAGAPWQNQAMPDYVYRLPVLRDREVAARATKRGITWGAALIELRRERLRDLAIADAALALHPGSRRRDEKARTAYRARMRARWAGAEPSQCDRPHRALAEDVQTAFVGEGWGDEA